MEIFIDYALHVQSGKKNIFLTMEKEFVKLVFHLIIILTIYPTKHQYKNITQSISKNINIKYH